MRSLAKKGRFMWVVLAIIPTAKLAEMIGKANHLDNSIIIAIQLPTLALQLFSFFILIRYGPEIFYRP